MVSHPLPPARRIEIRRSSRLAAWLVTGPLGHLCAGVVAWITLLARWLWARARGRELGV